MFGFAELHNVDELDELNQDAGWQTEYRQLKPGPFHARFWFGESSNIDITKEHLSGSLEVMAADQDDAVSLLIRDSSPGEVRFNGYPIDCGNLFMLLPGAEIHAHTQSNIGIYTFRIPLSRIADVAGAFDLQWGGFISGSSRKLQLPQETVNGFTQILNAKLLGRSAESVSCYTMDQAVDSFISSMLSLTDIQTMQKQRPKLGSYQNFKKTLAFIETNLGEKITVAELCQRADVGIRTLERQFEREIGLPALAYIKSRRLNAARRNLLTADPSTTCVTEVANKCGLPHLGRFSTDYHHFFGELPSETLLSSI